MYKIILVLILGMFSLTACGEELTESYLMQRPAVLKKEADRCQSTSIASQTPFCTMVFSAISKFMGIVTEQEINPEEFGRRILRSQMALAETKQIVMETSKELENLKQASANAEKIQQWKEKLAQQQQMLQAKQEEVAVLLAVVGNTNPG